MTAPSAFLAVALVGAAFTALAYRPSRFAPGVGVSFFAHWLTTELAAHHLVWQVVATVIFARLGAFSDWAGWLGLAISVASWAGLIGLVRAAHKVEHEVEDALHEALGDDYHADVEAAYAARDRALPGSRLPRLRLATAFYFRQGGIRRAKDLRYGPHGRRNLLDVWYPRDGVTQAPVLLWIHGGAWIVGHKAQQALPMLTHLTAQGWVCVSINYRLAPQGTFPDHLVDAKRALAWVREHIAEYGGDPDFVVVSGGSAGGHLSALLALTANDPEYQPGFEAADTSVQGAVPFYGVYDFTNRFGSRSKFDGWGFVRFIEQRVMQHRLRDDPAAFAKASPVDRVHADAPPFFVIHGTHDVLAPVGDAREFVGLLRAASRQPVAYAELKGAQHAFDVFHSIRTTHVIRGVERFAAWVHARHAHNATERRAG